MAVLVKKENLLFIGNNRTGSTAVGRALVSQLGGKYVPEKVLHIDGVRISKRHATLDQLEKYGLIPDSKDLLKFVFVRNPYDSLVSYWKKNLLKPRFAHTSIARFQLQFSTWVEEYLGSKPPKSMHARFVAGTDVVLRFESLSSDLDALFQKVGIKSLEIPQTNVTKDREADYRNYYSTEARRIIKTMYFEDLERYGYTF